MNVDEMELVSQLKDTEPLRPEAFGQARMALREAIEAGTPGLAKVPDQPRRPSRGTGRHPGRRSGLTPRRAGIGLGVGLAAAAAAVALVVATAQPPASSGRTRTASRPAHPARAADSRLVILAAAIRAAATRASDGPLPGNATLILSSQVNGSNPPQTGANLYTDSGDYYWAPTESGLPEAIAEHENLADGADAREVAAALYAVTGNLATARNRMVAAAPNPFGLGSYRVSSQHATAAQAAKKAAAAKKAPAKKAPAKKPGALVRPTPVPLRSGVTIPPGPQRREDFDNYVWNNSVSALTEGAGNPLVRAGVLRLLATVPEVTVTSSVTDGQRTLTLTAGTALFGGLTRQVLTINARTGIPVSSVSGVPGQKPSSIVTFRVSRVTVAAIAAGRY